MPANQKYLRKDRLDLFMNPRSVAIVGATRKSGPGSFNLIENLRAFGYKGKIFPVNPQAEEILGLKAYKDIRDLPEAVDIAILNTPRELIPRIIEDCADQGIAGVIVVPQGFADADEEGKRLQDQLTRLARDKGIRIMGPNTLGVQDSFSGFTSSFMPLVREAAPVGVICQSGVFFFGAAVFSGLLGQGIDLANACDLDLADALDYFGDDDRIRVIFAHVEGLKDGRRFLETAERVARLKPVITLKTGQSAQGARAAASHSGSMVGDYQVFGAAMEGMLADPDAFALLKSYGLPVAEHRLVKNLAEALEAVSSIGYPVALKTASSRIVHKTEAGGVVLDLQGPDELKAALQGMETTIRQRVPGAEEDGFIVQQMIPSGLEVLLGAKRDPQFGPVIIFGTGGIYTELWKDIAYGLVPLSREEAKQMIRKTKAYEIVKGFRGRKPLDEALLLEMLLRLSRLMEEVQEIREMEINPLVVFPQGGLAVDVRVIL